MMYEFLNNLHVLNLLHLPFQELLFLQQFLGWTDPVASSWQIEYGVTGFTQGTGTTAIVGTNPHTLSSLMPETTYQYYVRSICGAGDTSIWSTPVSFTTPPTCIGPNSLSVSAIMSNSADLGWVDSAGVSSWQVEYGEAGFSQGAGTFVVTNMNPFSLSSLNPNTEYEFYVKAICSAGDSSVFVGPVSFTTQCAVIVPSYTQDFNSFLPDCWEEAGDGNFVSGPTSLGFGDWGSSTIFSSQSAKVNLYQAEDQEWLLSPLFDLSGSANTISLDVAVTDYNGAGPDQMGSDDTVTLAYTENGTTWIPIKSWTVADTLSNALTTYSFTSPSTATNVRFAIRATDGSVDNSEDYDFHIDNFFVGTCPAPSNLTASNITDVSANLGWIENGSAGNWAIEYGLGGFTLGTGSTMSTTTNPYTLSSLTPNTTYEFYVRAVCGAGDSSTWAGPFSFVTACAVVTPNYSENFTNYIVNCWKQAEGGDLTVGPTNVGAGEWGSGITLPTPTARVNLFGNTRDEWLLSPLFDLSAGGYEMSIEVAVTEHDSTITGAMGSDDSVTIAYTENGTTWIPIRTWTDGDTLSSTLTSYTFPLSSTGSAVQFGILASDGSINDIENYDFHVDNFTISTIIVPITCPAPSALAVITKTATEVNLGWIENGTTTNWLIEWGPTGFLEGTGTSQVVTTNPRIISGLNSSTDYDFYVRSICGVGDTSLAFGPVSTTTDSLVGIASNLESLVNIYPNPSEGFINVEFSSFEENNSIELISVRGEVLQTIVMDAKLTTIDARDLPKGVYTLRIINGSEIGYRKVMIK